MIKDFIKEENIILNLKSRKKDSAIEEMLAETDFTEDKKKLISHSLKQREVLGTTGIGKGIAIPHARSLVLDKLELYIGVSKKGIEYDSMDGKPVHIIFLIMAPPLDTANQYLILLGRIAALSRKITKNNDFMDIDSKENFIEMIEELENNREESE
ncbi:MAG: PTS sugar transporter subunit IIA [bacterium]